MDGNGRWAKERGLPRTEGHKRGEDSLFDVIMGAIELGVPYLSAYAFSTENWKRSPDEVRFLMGFNRDVIRRRRDQLHSMGVRVRWAGRRPRLWRSVIKELETAEEMTRHNDVLTLQFCVNYGGRAEIADAAAAIARDVRDGGSTPARSTSGSSPATWTSPASRTWTCSCARRGAAHVQLPALAVGLRRDGLPRHALARLRPAPLLARVRGVRLPRPPLRRRRPQRGRRRQAPTDT